MKSILKVSSIFAVLLSVCILMTLLSSCVQGNYSAVNNEPAAMADDTNGDTADDYDYDVLGNTDYVFVGRIIRNDVLKYDPFVPVEELPKDENGEPISTGHYDYCTVQVVKNVKGSLVTDTDIKLEATMERSLLDKDMLPAVGEDYIFCSYAYMDGTLSLPEESLNIPYSEDTMAKIEDALDEPKDNPRPTYLSIYDTDVLGKFTEDSEIAEYVYNENHYNYFMMNCDYVFVGNVKDINGIKKTPYQTYNGETGYYTAAIYDIEVLENIKGSLVTDNIELLKECEVSESGEPVLYAEWDILPEVGETYIFCARTDEERGWDITVRPLPEAIIMYSDETLAELNRINESHGEYEMRHPMSIYDTAYEG